MKTVHCLSSSNPETLCKIDRGAIRVSSDHSLVNCSSCQKSLDCFGGKGNCSKDKYQKFFWNSSQIELVRLRSDRLCLRCHERLGTDHSGTKCYHKLPNGAPNWDSPSSEEFVFSGTFLNRETGESFSLRHFTLEQNKKENEMKEENSLSNTEIIKNEANEMAQIVGARKLLKIVKRTIKKVVEKNPDWQFGEILDLISEKDDKGILISSVLGFAIPLLPAHNKENSKLASFLQAASSALRKNAMLEGIDEAVSVIVDPAMDMLEDLLETGGEFISSFGGFSKEEIIQEIKGLPPGEKIAIPEPEPKKEIVTIKNPRKSP